MAENIDADWDQDGELIAYLDGQLALNAREALERRIARDPALQERLRALEAGGRPFWEAFDAVLEATPHAHLTAMLNRELQRHRSRTGKMQMPAWAAIAASFVMLGLGFGVGYGMRSLTPSSQPAAQMEQAEAGFDAWERMLASDLALYTPEVLSMIGPAQAPSEAELQATGRKLSIDLSRARVQLPDLMLKQARLLAFNGKPFIQLIYLDPEYGPVAFCIFARAEGQRKEETERRAGMNLVYWSGTKASYMLIGRASRARLQTLAAILAKRFPPTST